MRLSGPQALRLAERFFRPDDNQSIGSRGFRWHRGRVRLDPHQDAPALCYVMRAPRSYTRQDVIEWHLPGCAPLVERLLERLLEAGARPAGPGEFTLRAFLNGRIDLVQARAVAAIVDAADADQLRTAVDELAGGLSAGLRTILEQLTDLAAQVEALLDFPEEDLPPIDVEALAAALDRLADRLTALEAEAGRRRSVGSGLEVTVCGRTNAGKSSLVNALAGREAALVSPRPGTTRDFVRVEMAAEGIAFDLIDTAGLRPAAEAIEAQAQAVALARRQRSAVVLLCLDTTQPLHEEDLALLAGPGAEAVIPVATKVDLEPVWDAARDLPPAVGSRLVRTSAREGTGIAALRQRLVEAVRRGAAGGSGAWALEAQWAAGIRRARGAAACAGRWLRAGPSLELAAIELREALAALGETLGTVTTDDLLDAIFARFCIGK